MDPAGTADRLAAIAGVLPAGRLPHFRRRGIPTRVDVPYGPAWFGYWLRRLAESRGTLSPDNVPNRRW